MDELATTSEGAAVRRSTAAFTLAAAALSGGCEPLPEPATTTPTTSAKERPAPEPEVAAEPPPAEPPPPTLREAMEYLLMPMCGMAMFERPYKVRAEMVEKAGANLAFVLAEIIADPQTSLHMVDGAAHRGVGLPFTPELHRAIRQRISDPGFDPAKAYCWGLAAYFAAHGDAADLAWLEAIRPTSSESDQRHVLRSVTELRERLAAAKTAAAPQSPAAAPKPPAAVAGE